MRTNRGSCLHSYDQRAFCFVFFCFLIPGKFKITQFCTLIVELVMFPANHLQPSAGIFSGKHQPSYQLKAQDVKKTLFTSKTRFSHFFLISELIKLKKTLSEKQHCCGVAKHSLLSRRFQALTLPVIRPSEIF